MIPWNPIIRQDNYGCGSLIMEIAMGHGVTLGAMAWRIGAALSHPNDATTPFRIVAAVAFIGVWDSVALEKVAGDHVVRRARTNEA
jgi:hypothetical protein